MGGRRGIGQPKPAHSVAEPIVPLAKRGREVTGLPAARPHVPRLGNELGLADHGVRAQGHQEGVVLVVAFRVAAERDRKVEPEAVYPNVGEPVTQ